MNKKCVFRFLILAFVATALFGCGFGLAPSWEESGKTTVSLRIASLGVEPSGTVSRAVMPGSNFLYIRTIGIPGETTGALYGPYRVTAGSEFVTTDIPPGQYDRVYALCSGKDLESAGGTYSFFSGMYTFRGLMSLPDAQMVTFASEDTDKSSLDALFDGMVSFGEKDGVTIIQGKMNSLSLTLIPITSAGYEINFVTAPNHLFNATERSRHLYRISGITVSLPVTSGSLSFTLSGSSISTVSALALYSSTGEEIPVTRSGSDLMTGFTWTIAAADVARVADASGNVELYQYLDYTGMVGETYTNTVNQTTIAVDGLATSAWQGHKVLLAIYDEAAVTNVAAGKALIDQVPVANELIDLSPSTGDGSCSISGQKLQSGTKYYLSAQVDTTNHYASLADFSAVDLATLIPYRGDYTLNGDPALTSKGVYTLVPFTAGSSVSLASSSFSEYTSYVLFVSRDGVPTDDGSDYNLPSTLYGVLSLHTALRPAQVYVIDDIEALTQQTVSGTVTIQSYGSTIHTLSSTTLPAQHLFMVTGNLEFNRVVIDCSSAGSGAQSLLIMDDGAGATLSLGSGATLIGTGATSLAPNGGGIYVGTGGALNMWGSTVKNCRTTSSGAGGAVFFAADPSTQGFIGPGVLFEGNYASQGGAIYVGTSATVKIISSVFLSNTTQMAGNGVICNDGNVSAKDLSFLTNSADYNHIELSYGHWSILP